MSRFCRAAALACVVGSPCAIAQVQVNDGQTLTEADLTAGLFGGQAFTLAPGTVFDINDGGVIGPVGDGSVSPAIAFDFNGSTVNVNSGGLFASVLPDMTSAVANLVLNIESGGVLGGIFHATQGSVVSVMDGRIGRIVARDSVVNLHGTPSGSFEAQAGSVVNVHSGTLNDDCVVEEGSEVNLYGGVFGRDFLARGGVLNIAGGGVGPNFVASGSSIINLASGGIRENAIVRDQSVLNVMGGGVRSGLIAEGGTINLSAGLIDLHFDAHAGSAINISGGRIEGNFRGLGAAITMTGGAIGSVSLVAGGTTLDMSGGRIESAFDVYADAVVNISGGVVDSVFTVQEGGVVNISGGRFGRFFRALEGSAVTITGGEFSLFTPSSRSIDDGLAPGSILSGTLADGTVFILAAEVGDRIDPGAVAIQTVELDPIDLTPIVISDGAGPTTGLRLGQRLTLNGSGSLDEHFAVKGGHLRIEGGSVATGLEGIGCYIGISGGVVSDLSAYWGADVEITGGTVESFINAYNGATVSLGDGFVSSLRAHAGSEVVIAGGDVGGAFIDGGVVDVYGGDLGRFEVLAGSAVNLFVTEILVDGAALDLKIGEAAEVLQRGGAVLEATLLDGTALDFVLNGVLVSGQDYFDPLATLTVTLIPTPGAAPLLALAGLLSTRRRH